jgi:hypothetical protein
MFDNYGKLTQLIKNFIDISLKSGVSYCIFEVHIANRDVVI